MDQGILPFIVALVTFGILGFGMMLRPDAVVRMMEEMAARSRDPLTRFNRGVFDPTRRERNVRGFRILGALWVVVVFVITVLLFLARNQQAAN